MGNPEVSFTIRVKDAATAALKDIQKAAEGVTEKLFSFKDILKELSVAAAAFSLAEVVKDMVDLGVSADKTFRTIAANLPTATQGIAQLKEEIEGLADSTGRGLEELEAAAATISKLGVSSAEELAQQLAAATKLADATGASVEDTAQLLIQLRREFHLTGDEALETAAKLASATQGKVSVTELFSAFQAAAPIFEKFGIGVDTATKAIVALIQKGDGLRQVRTDLAQLDKAGIEQYASQAKIAGDAMEQLTTRAAIYEGSTAATLERLKNSWKESLEAIYGHIETFVAGAYTLFEKMGGVTGQLQRMGLTGTAAAYSALTTKSKPVLSSTFTSIATPGPTPAHVMTAAEKKQIEDAEKAILDLDDAAEKLAQTTEAATPKSVAFSAAIDDWSKKAIEAGMSTAQIEAHLKALNATLAGLRGDEALKRIADQSKATEETFGKLADGMAKFGGDAGDKLQAEFDDLVASLKKGAEQFKDDSDATIEFEQRLADLRTAFGQFKQAVDDVASVQQQLAGIQNDLFTHGDDWNKLTDDWDKAIQLSEELEQKQKAATNPQAAKEYGAELEKVRQAIAEIGRALGLLEGKQTDSGKQIEEIAQKWATVARAIIGASQALGQMGSQTAAVVQNLVNLGEGIAKIASGKDVAGGVAEGVGSLGGLVASIINMGHAASQAQQHARELTASINSLFLGLEQQITGGNSLADKIASAKSQYDQARNTIERDEGGKANQTQREKDLDRLNADEAKRIEQLKEEDAELQKNAQEDYKVRQLRAEGLNDEADSLEFAEKQAREYKAAIDAGATADTLAALAAAQAAEATEFLVQQQQKAAEAALNAATTTASQYDQIHHVTDPVAQFADKAKAYAGAGGALGDLFKGFDLSNLSSEDIAKLDSKFQDLFDTLNTSPDTVDKAGLSVQDLIAALLDLDKSAQSVADGVESAAQAFNDANSQLSDDADVYGYDPTTLVGKQSTAYGIDLSSFDLSTKAGVAGAIAMLQQDYGVATDPVRKQQDKALIDNLRKITFADSTIASGGNALGIPSTSAGGSALSSAFQGLTTIQADQWLDVNRQTLFVGRAQLDVLRDIRNLLTPAPMPVTLSGAGGGGGGQSAPRGGGSSVVNLGGINVSVSGAAAADPTAIGTAVSQQTLRAINVAQGRQLIQQGIGLDGNIRVRSRPATIPA